MAGGISMPSGFTPMAMGGKPMAAQLMGKMTPPPGSIVQGPGRNVMPSVPFGGLNRFMGGGVPRVAVPPLRTFNAGGGQSTFNPFQQLRVADPRRDMPRVSVDGGGQLPGGGMPPSVYPPIMDTPQIAPPTPDWGVGGQPGGQFGQGFDLLYRPPFQDRMFQDF